MKRYIIIFLLLCGCTMNYVRPDGSSVSFQITVEDALRIGKAAAKVQFRRSLIPDPKKTEVVLSDGRKVIIE